MLSRTPAHCADARIMSMTYSTDTIRNRTRDLRACSALPQPDAPPRRSGISAHKSGTRVLSFRIVITSLIYTPDLYAQSAVFKTSAMFHLATQSHYRPGHALRVPGGWGSLISRQLTHEGGKVVNSTHPPPLPPRKYSWYSFLLQFESIPRAIVRPEGLC